MHTMKNVFIFLFFVPYLLACAPKGELFAASADSCRYDKPLRDVSLKEDGTEDGRVEYIYNRRGLLKTARSYSSEGPNWENQYVYRGKKVKITCLDYFDDYGEGRVMLQRNYKYADCKRTVLKYEEQWHDGSRMESCNYFYNDGGRLMKCIVKKYYGSDSLRTDLFIYEDRKLTVFTYRGIVDNNGCADPIWMIVKEYMDDNYEYDIRTAYYRKNDSGKFVMKSITYKEYDECGRKSYVRVGTEKAFEEWRCSYKDGVCRTVYNKVGNDNFIPLRSAIVETYYK